MYSRWQTLLEHFVLFGLLLAAIVSCPDAVQGSAREDFRQFYEPFADKLEDSLLNVSFKAVRHNGGSTALLMGVFNDQNYWLDQFLLPVNQKDASRKQLLAKFPDKIWPNVHGGSLANRDCAFGLRREGNASQLDQLDLPAFKGVTVGLCFMTVPVALPEFGRTYSEIVKGDDVVFRSFEDAKWKGKAVKQLVIEYELGRLT